MPSQAETKRWRALRRRKGRDATRCFLAEGARLIGEMLDWDGKTVAVLHAEGSDREPEVRALLDSAAANGVRVEAVSPAWIDDIADATTPQSVIAIGEIPEYRWEDIGPGIIVLLDGVQDPGNAGTLVRTATGLGASGVVGLGETADPWGPKALRASAGAVFRRPVFRTSAGDALLRLGERGAAVWAASAEGDPMEHGSVLPAELALVLGSEAHGVSEQLRAAADRLVSVPLVAGVESLNVAAAGAILLDRLTSEWRGDA